MHHISGCSAAHPVLHTAQLGRSYSKQTENFIVYYSAIVQIVR